MQKRYLILSAIVLALAISFTFIARHNSFISELKGYVETVSDFGIRKISFPQITSKEIFKKRTDYFVYAFDTSPDGKNRVLAVEGVGYNLQRLVMYLSNNEMKTILSREIILGPNFSPDGSNIAYLSSADKTVGKGKKLNKDLFVYTIKPDGSSNRCDSNLPLDRFRTSWFPDGERLAASTNDLKIYIINTKNSEAKEIIDFGEAPAISHDGKKIAYLSNDVDASIKKKIIDYRNITEKEYQNIIAEKGTRQKELIELDQYSLKHSIYMYDVVTGKSKKLTEAVWIEQPVIWSPDDKYLLYNDRAYVSDDIYVVDLQTGQKKKITAETGTVMVWK
jgi:Tol biopolymer transport system component